MKIKKPFRFYVVVCIALLLAGLPQPCLSAEDGLGNEYACVTQTLCEGLEYREIHAVNRTGAQIGYAFTLSPGKSAVAAVGFGRSMYGRKTLTEIVDTAQSQGINVLGGINGDAFAVQTGLPLSCMISQGEILAANTDGELCFGVDQNGQAIIGSPQIFFNITAGEKSLAIELYNQLPEEKAGPVLLSSDFAGSTKSKHSCTEIIIKPEAQAKFTPGNQVNGTVEQVYRDTTDSVIPKGYLAISIPSSHPQAAQYGALSTGSKIQISVSADAAWADAVFAVGALSQIVKDGKLQESAFDTAGARAVSARTCAGVSKEGKLVFFAADGDGHYGAGISLKEAAAEMIAMGCVQAVCLDSSQSTTVALKETGNTACSVVNHPSSGSERLISNGILFYSSALSYEPVGLEILPARPFVISGGGTLTLSCSAVSASGEMLSEELSEVKYTILSGPGKLTGAKFTAGNTCGKTEIQVAAKAGDKTLYGKTTLQIIAAVDDIVCDDTRLCIPAGGQEKLNIYGVRSSLPVGMCAAKLTWTFDGVNQVTPTGSAVAQCEYGYLDNELVFHADQSAAGKTFTLTAQYGYRRITLEISIGKEPVVITSFDNRTEKFSSYLNFNPYYSYQYTSGKRHTSALKFKGNNVTYKEPVWIGSGVSSIKIWLSGQVHAPYITLKDEYGNSASVYYQKEKDYEHYNGWALYSAALPDSLHGNIAIVSPVCSAQRMDCSIDEITAYYDLPLSIYCDTASSWAEAYIQTIYEMDIASGSLSGGKRYYYPQQSITRAEFAKFIVSYHKIDATAYSDYELNFGDYYAIPDWAKNYVKAAAANGLMSGSSNPDGSVDFLPADKITRAQILSVIGRKVTAQEKTLPFADAADIPAWALSTIKKVYGAGLVTGYPDGTLKPGNPVTRAEAATMLYSLYGYDYNQA